MKYWGGIEAGGTKFVCVISNQQFEIVEEITIPTETPDITLPRVVDFFRQQTRYPLEALGVACFGPLELDRNSPQYGYISATPKPGWRHFDMVGTLARLFQIPIGFDTDVNAAALGEHRLGAAQDTDHFIYLTVGTGIGGGVLVDGHLLHGASHPEMGHLLIPHDRSRDPFEGVCPYHRNCLEGLASGPSMKARWNVESALDLPPEHAAWDLEAHYLSIALTNYILTLSPKRIVMGGGVMKQIHLFDKIRKCVPAFIAGYIQHRFIDQEIEQFIVPAGLGQRAGTFGAIALAEDALRVRRKL